MTQWRIAVKEQRILSPNFEVLVGEIFLQNKQNCASCEQGYVVNFLKLNISVL